MLQKYLAAVLLCLLLFPLHAQEDGDPGIKIIDIDSFAAGKLKAGLELGYPFAGLEAGYKLTEKLEPNLLLGSDLDFDSVVIGMSLMYTLLDLEIEENIYPLRAAPVLYTRFNSDFIEFSIGGLLRGEYDFDMPLNVYAQLGIIYNGEGLIVPIAIGARYIF